LGKLFTLMCLCHQAVLLGTGQGAGWLRVYTGISSGASPGPTLGNEYGKPLPFLHQRRTGGKESVPGNCRYLFDIEPDDDNVSLDECFGNSFERLSLAWRFASLSGSQCVSTATFQEGDRAFVRAL